MASFGIERSRVRALVSTEQLALDERVRKRRGVDLDERAFGAATRMVDRAGEQALAGTAVAQQQDRLVGRGDPPRLLDDLAHFRALRDHAPEAFASIEPLRERAHARGQPAAFGDPADPQTQLVHREWLDQIVDGTFLHRIDRILGGRMRGHDHDVGRRRHATCFSQHRHPIDVGHAQVRQYDVESPGSNPFDPVAAARCVGDVVADAFEHLRQHAAELGLVVDDQDARHRCSWVPTGR